MKSIAADGTISNACRTPQGVRGLKSAHAEKPRPRRRSHPARGAWIEILLAECHGEKKEVAPRKGCVD